MDDLHSGDRLHGPTWPVCGHAEARAADGRDRRRAEPRHDDAGADAVDLRRLADRLAAFASRIGPAERTVDASSALVALVLAGNLMAVIRAMAGRAFPQHFPDPALIRADLMQGAGVLLGVDVRMRDVTVHQALACAEDALLVLADAGRLRVVRG